MGFRLNRLEIRETDTSVVQYTREDWVADNRLFARLESQENIRCTCPGVEVKD
jgi:hypothetical protein